MLLTCDDERHQNGRARGTSQLDSGVVQLLLDMRVQQRLYNANRKTACHKLREETH